MSSLRGYVAFGLMAGLLGAGCTPTQNVRGYVIDDARFVGIESGVDDKNSVLDVLGSPSNVSTFGADTWYYVARKTERLAFFEERVLDQRVVAIEFDESGIVAGVERYEAEDARPVAMNERVTPTRGKQLSLTQQLFGNIGRFNRDDGAE